MSEKDKALKPEDAEKLKFEGLKDKNFDGPIFEELFGKSGHKIFVDKQLDFLPPPKDSNKLGNLEFIITDGDVGLDPKTKELAEKLIQDYKDNPEKYQEMLEKLKTSNSSGKFKIDPIDGASFTPKNTDAKGDFLKITLQNKEAPQKEQNVGLFGIKNEKIPNNKEKNV